MTDATQSRSLPVTPSRSCPTCDNARVGTWCALHNEPLDALNRSKKSRLYPAGATLYVSGGSCPGLYCLVAGTVLIERFGTGGTRGIAIAESQDVLGWPEFFNGSVYQATATCQTDVEACLIPAQVVRQALECTPELALRLLSHSMHEAEQAARASLDERYASARQRLARALVILKARHGIGAETGEIRIDLPISRRDLADLIAVRPETLSRAIHDLELDNVARFDGRTVVVPDLDRMLDELEPPAIQAA